MHHLLLSLNIIFYTKKFISPINHIYAKKKKMVQKSINSAIITWQICQMRKSSIMIYTTTCLVEKCCFVITSCCCPHLTWCLKRNVGVKIIPATNETCFLANCSFDHTILILRFSKTEICDPSHQNVPHVGFAVIRYRP